MQFKECINKNNLKFIQLTDTLWKQLFRKRLFDDESYKIDSNHFISAIIFDNEFYIDRMNTKIIQKSKVFQINSNNKEMIADINDYLIYDEDDYLKVCNAKQFTDKFKKVEECANV